MKVAIRARDYCAKCGRSLEIVSHDHAEEPTAATYGVTVRCPSTVCSAHAEVKTFTRIYKNEVSHVSRP